MRVLLTDLLFPTNYVSWRLVEIISFMRRYETDIYIPKHLSHVVPIDYEGAAKICNLEDYDILIFNSKYSHLNKYNKDFNGLSFIGKSNGAFAFRLKKYRSQQWNHNVYDIVYHIMFASYAAFKRNIYPIHKQWIHYHAGCQVRFAKSLPKNIGGVIVTQKFYQRLMPKGLNVVPIYGVPYLLPENKIRQKDINNKTLRIAATVLTHKPETKGLPDYYAMADYIRNKYPKLDIEYILIGTHKPDRPYIKYIQPMPQEQLSQYYYDLVDIYVNPETGILYQGWPLGSEALLEGAVLITTDHKNMNTDSQFNFKSDEIFISNKNIPETFGEFVVKLYNDRELLHKYSIKGQQKAHELFSYEKQMLPRFEAIQKGT